MQPNAIVVVIDRLQAAYLGPYGNNSVITPAWNALAAESCLMENHLADSNDLATTYRAWWGGGQAWSAAGPSLAEALEDRAIHAALLTDEPSLLEHEMAERFAERIVIGHEGDASRAVDQPHDSQLARVFETALRWLEDKPPQPFLCWVHACGMAGPWDAPYDLRAAMADDEDPDPPRFVDPPQLDLPDDYDPDELLGIAQAYSAQVMLADMCLGTFLENLDNYPPARRALLACTAPRGYPLGEHGQVGCHGERLTGEALHIPLVIRFPRGKAAATRERSLSHPADLYATLAEWFELPAVAETCWRRSLLPLKSGTVLAARPRQAALSNDQQAIRTDDWLLIVDRQRLEPAEETEELVRDGLKMQLYAKPDDRYEFNNVHNLCVEQAALLAGELGELRREIEAVGGKPSGGDASVGGAERGDSA